MMRGIDSRNEIDPSMLLRDTRTFGQRVGHFFSNPSNVAIVLVSMAACAFLFSIFPTIVLLT